MKNLLPYFILPQSIFILFIAGCGYRFYESTSHSPYKGIKNVAIPVFKNRTSEIGLEGLFTSAFMDEVERGGVFVLTDENRADAIFNGIIEKVEVTPLGLEICEGGTRVKTFRLRVSFSACLKEKSKDGRVLWKIDNISEENDYAGMDIEVGDSAIMRKGLQMEAYREVAEDLMEDVYDLMVKDF